MKKQAFTLVELIVVVTILAILATIGFVSYSGYLTGVRDTNRIASLTAISDGLELYRTKNDLPLPDNSVEVQVEGETIARQGYAGSNVLQTIEYSKAGKDPKDDQYYSYYLTDDKKHYQMMAFLEESDNLETRIINTINAATDYSNRHPKVYGKRLGILTDEDNTPIQEITSIKTDGNFNMTGGTSQEYVARFADDESISGTGETLKAIRQDSSCMRLKLFGKKKSGYYQINPSGTGSFEVYCDMVTAGGGWTRTHVLGAQAILGDQATIVRPAYTNLFTQNRDFAGSGFTSNISPIHFQEYAYLTADEKSDVEMLDGGFVKTVGYRNEGMNEWLRAYKIGTLEPFLRKNWIYYNDLEKKNKRTLYPAGQHQTAGTYVSGFRNMHSERLLSGNTNGTTVGAWGITNMPFSKRGLTGNWCHGGDSACWTGSGSTWASLWVR